MSKNLLQVRLTDELEEMKQYLIKRGCKISHKVREFIVQLYGFEKNREAANITNSPTI